MTIYQLLYFNMENFKPFFNLFTFRMQNNVQSLHTTELYQERGIASTKHS